MPTINIDEIKKDIAKFLERIFMERKIARDMGLDVSEIDTFIETEGAKQMQRFDTMTVDDTIDYMLNEIKDFIEKP